MKVLSTENTPSMTFSCNNCHAKLEAVKSDMGQVVHDQRDGDAVVFKCANCSSDIWVAKSLVPRDWLVTQTQAVAQSAASKPPG